MKKRYEFRYDVAGGSGGFFRREAAVFHDKTK